MGGVKRKKKTEFLFKELGKEAQAKAIEDARKGGQFDFDDADADSLTEWFEQDLEDHYQIGTMKAYWSLGYCQGDGVCFQGQVDVQRFIKSEKMEKEFGELIDKVSAKITHESRYCHWNSMHVEVEVTGGNWEDYLSNEDARERREWEDLVDQRRREQREADRMRNAPVYEWQARALAWERRQGRVIREGKQDWSPREGRGPGPKPAPLDIQIPPGIEEPELLLVARLDAEKAYEGLYQKGEEFRTWLEERVKEISREMEKAGYSEIEHHQSDEFLAERLEDMDWTYQEDGTRTDED
jgi:hypothetical protein